MNEHAEEPPEQALRGALSKALGVLDCFGQTPAPRGFS